MLPKKTSVVTTTVSFVSLSRLHTRQYTPSKRDEGRGERRGEEERKEKNRGEEGKEERTREEGDDVLFV